MKILLAPDSFKGSLSALDFCRIAEKTIKSLHPDYIVENLPLADGGEGTLNCLISALGGKKIECHVQNSLYEEIDVPVGFFDGGRTALIESALSNGLPLIKGRENPLETSTYGVGQMIAFAVDYGSKNIILTLGGSSTNDCGLGMLAALGSCFYNKEGISFVPTGGTLSQVADFDFSQMYPRLVGARIDAMCDVENPLCGQFGASAVFAPQKGADSEMVKILEEGCCHIRDLFKKKLGVDFSEDKGAGAAGGMGFAVLSALKGRFESGIDKVLDLCDFSQKVKTCDLIITGEGAFDSQSLMGKAVGGVIKKSCGKSVKVICGRLSDDGVLRDLPENVQICDMSRGQTLEYAMAHAEENLQRAVEGIFSINLQSHL